MEGGGLRTFRLPPAQARLPASLPVSGVTLACLPSLPSLPSLPAPLIPLPCTAAGASLCAWPGATDEPRRGGDRTLWHLQNNTPTSVKVSLRGVPPSHRAKQTHML